MSKPWLLLDVSNIAYRSMYVMGNLRYGDDATGAIYGVFKEVVRLMELFATTKCVFCFDSGSQVRKDVYSDYKSNRKRTFEMTDEEKLFRADLKIQLSLLRVKMLKEIGFRNICWQQGFEADDVIASICEDYPDKEFIIVSTDQDMYQLLSESVSIYNPMVGRSITKKSFEAEYKIVVDKWVNVKAIAGCSSDSVLGVKGVGEVTAIKFLNGLLPSKTKAYQKIMESKELIDRNLELVRLPFPGTLAFPVKKDRVSMVSWNKGIQSLGMATLINQFPMYLKKRIIR